MPGHILTGPVAVQGAMPGDVLQIDILDVSLRQDWGFNRLWPPHRTLPQDFKRAHTIIPLDAERSIATLPWGLSETGSIFWRDGCRATAQWGRISTCDHGCMTITSTIRGRAQRCICQR